MWGLNAFRHPRNEVTRTGWQVSSLAASTARECHYSLSGGDKMCSPGKAWQAHHGETGVANGQCTHHKPLAQMDEDGTKREVIPLNPTEVLLEVLHKLNPCPAIWAVQE